MCIEEGVVMEMVAEQVAAAVRISEKVPTIVQSLPALPLSPFFTDCHCF